MLFQDPSIGIREAPLKNCKKRIQRESGTEG